MFRFAVTACFALLALPVDAGCLTAESIDQGVVFRRADGHSGSAIRKDGQIAIDYATEDGVRVDQRWAQLGIYETAMIQLMIDEEAMGSGTAMIAQRFVGNPPEPVVGGSWQGKVKMQYDSDNPSIIEPLTQKWVWDADFRFLPEFSGKLSGCSYRIIPVEARFRTTTSVFDQRFVYFPDLGFGLETKRDGVTNKVMSLKARP